MLTPSPTDIGPSPHLSWAELACKDGTPYPLNWRATRALILAAEFEAVRTLCGDRPIRIASAYRPEAYNKKVGGGRYSQHRFGRALDLHPTSGITVTDLEHAVRIRASFPESQLKGIGIYPTFLHIDVRPAAQLAIWYGKRTVADAGETS